jgi:hypothetical protein
MCLLPAADAYYAFSAPFVAKENVEAVLVEVVVECVLIVEVARWLEKAFYRMSELIDGRNSLHS